jgi:hypothetical protein
MEVYIPSCLHYSCLETDTGPLRGGFRRFVIRFCGSTYSTVNHLNIISPVNPGGSCTSIQTGIISGPDSADMVSELLF